MSLLQFVELADYPQYLPRVARWYFDQWLSHRSDVSVANVESNLTPYLNKRRVPFLLLALDQQTNPAQSLVGAAELKIREMTIYPADTYPAMEYWLGGVYVKHDIRGRGIATQLIEQIIARAATMGIDSLYLQTERLDGGLYAKLGWQAVEEVYYHDRHVLVMAKAIEFQSE